MRKSGKSKILFCKSLFLQGLIPILIWNYPSDAKTVSAEEGSEGLGGGSTGLGQGTGGGAVGLPKYPLSGAHPQLSPQSSSSYYGSASSYNYPGNGYAYNGYNNNNHLMGSGTNYNPYLTDPIYERSGKEFNTRTSAPVSGSSNHAYEASPSSQQIEYGGLAMASGGHGHHTGHHGHGWGWGWGKGYTKVDNSAIGLLGLIGLFSLLQNVLLFLTTTTTTTAAGRKKREIGQSDETETDITTPEQDGVVKANRISMLIFPALNVIAHARQGKLPLECTHREVCVANQILVKELGIQGRSVGSMMSSAISKLLKEADNSGSIEKLVSQAGLSGRNGKNCHETYPVCVALGPGGSSCLPALMEPQRLMQLNPANQENFKAAPGVRPSQDQ